MSFERIIYGYIDSPFCHGKEDFHLFHRRNNSRLESLPVQYKDAEDWQTKPVITRGFFAVSSQDETHLSQIIHFGGSYKCYIGDTWEKDWSEWLLTFEQILRGMYWYSVTLHVIGEGEEDRVCGWIPTKRAFDAMFSEEKPIMEWEYHSGFRSSWETVTPSEN